MIHQKCARFDCDFQIKLYHKMDRIQMCPKCWASFYPLRDIEYEKKYKVDGDFKNAYEEYAFEESLIKKFIQPERLSEKTPEKEMR